MMSRRTSRRLFNQIKNDASLERPSQIPFLLDLAADSAILFEMSQDDFLRAALKAYTEQRTKR